MRQPSGRLLRNSRSRKNAGVSVSSCVLTAWWDRATTGAAAGGAAPSVLAIGLVFVPLLLLEAEVPVLGFCVVYSCLLSLTLLRGCHFGSFAATHPCLCTLPTLCAGAEQ